MMKKLLVLALVFVVGIYVLETQDVVFYENLKGSVSENWSDLNEDTNPVFVGEDIEVTVTTPTTLAVVKAGLTVSDSTDGDLTSSIVVVSDMYTGNETVIGNYDIVFSAVDLEGNITTFTVTITVVADPVV